MRKLLYLYKKQIVIAGILCGISLGIGGGVYAGLGGTIRPSSPSDIDLQKGLVAHLKFDGNAKDSTPYGNNGTVSGAVPAADRKGKSGGAYSFNGSSSYIVVTSNHLRSTHNSGEFTYSLWYSAANSGALITRGSTNGCEYEPVIKQDIVQFSGCAGSGVVTGLTPPGAGWNHMLVSVSTTADTVKTYVNGTFTNSKTLSSIKAVSDRSTVIAANASQNTLYIGAQQTLAGSGTLMNFFQGSVDDVKIYNRALSDSEAGALHKQYDTSTKTNAGQKGLVAHWKLDGNMKDSTPYTKDSTTVTGVAPVGGTDRKGNVQKAMKFSQDGYTTSQNIDLANMPFAISFWAKVDAYSTDASTAGGQSSSFVGNSNGSATLNSRLHLGLRNGKAFMGFFGNDLAGASTPLLGVWNHYVFQVNASGNKAIYVNGILDGSSTHTTLLTNGMNMIGYNMHDGRLNGSMDDVRVYAGKVLSINEISNLYKTYDSQINVYSQSVHANAANITGDLKGHWAFNGNATDTTPYSNNGIVTGGAVLTTDRRGRSNSAYTFNGAPQYIDMGTNVPDLSFTDNFTISAWIYPTAYNAGNYFGLTNGILAKGPATTFNYGLQLNNDTTITFVKRTGAEGLQWTNFTTSSLQNRWSLITVSVQAGTISMYRNGSLVGSQAVGAIQGVSTDRFIIGANTTSNASTAFIGKIDDVRIYGRALSANDIAALYSTYY